MKLKLLVTGTGRDGTKSMTHVLNGLFEQEGQGRKADHEYACRESYNAFDAFTASGDIRALDRLRAMFADCPHDAVVGNGYAFVLPYLRDLLPPDLAFIHLQRRDRDAGIRSWVKHAGVLPESNGYVPCPDGGVLVKRTTAAHLGEMKQEAWDALPLAEKFGWYYDKTHALLAGQCKLFPRSMHVYTEDLSNETVLNAIAAFVGVTPHRPILPEHKNRFTYADISQIDPYYVQKAQWLFGNFDFNRACRDELYPVDYFIERFYSWYPYLLNDVDKEELSKHIVSPQDVIKRVDEGAALLDRWARLFHEWQDYLRGKYANADAPPQEGTPRHAA